MEEEEASWFMNINLTPELIERIIFAMEDQSCYYIFDTDNGTIVAEDDVDDPDEDYYIDIPKWTPANGFQLMEQFIVSLNNPVFREKLREAIRKGKGAFKKFKAVIKERSEIEQLWYNYKKKHMVQIILKWAKSNEEWFKISQLSAEIEDESEELLLSDFEFLLNDSQLNSECEKLRGSAAAEMFSGCTQSIIESLNGQKADTLSSEEIFAARSPSGELCGFCIYTFRNQNCAYIKEIYVVPEFRSLGIAKELLFKTMQQFQEQGVESVYTSPIATKMSPMIKWLEQWGFKPLYTGLKLSTVDWGHLTES